MVSLSQQANRELFHRLVRKYFSSDCLSEENPPRVVDRKKLNQFARQFIRLEKLLADDCREKFLCLYFIGVIRFHLEQYHAAYQWLKKAMELRPDEAYVFMDMYAGCLFILRWRQHRYLEAREEAFKYLFMGMTEAERKADWDTYHRLKEKLDLFYGKKTNFLDLDPENPDTTDSP